MHGFFVRGKAWLVRVRVWLVRAWRGVAWLGSCVAWLVHAWLVRAWCGVVRRGVAWLVGMVHLLGQLLCVGCPTSLPFSAT